MVLAVFRRRHYGVKASPLQCNRVAVTVQSRRRYGVIASPLRCNRDAVTVQSQNFLAENTLTRQLRAVFPL